MNCATPSLLVVLLPITDFAPLSAATNLVFFTGAPLLVAVTVMTCPSLSKAPLLLCLRLSGKRVARESILADNLSYLIAETVNCCKADGNSNSSLTNDLGANSSLLVFILMLLDVFAIALDVGVGQLPEGASRGLITISACNWDVDAIPFAKQSRK